MVNREVQSMRTCNGQKDAPRERVRGPKARVCGSPTTQHVGYYLQSL